MPNKRISSPLPQNEKKNKRIRSDGTRDDHFHLHSRLQPTDSFFCLHDDVMPENNNSISHDHDYNVIYNPILHDHDYGQVLYDSNSSSSDLSISDDNHNTTNHNSLNDFSDDINSSNIIDSATIYNLSSNDLSISSVNDNTTNINLSNNSSIDSHLSSIADSATIRNLSMQNSVIQNINNLMMHDPFYDSLLNSPSSSSHNLSINNINTNNINNVNNNCTTVNDISDDSSDDDNLSLQNNNRQNANVSLNTITANNMEHYLGTMDILCIHCHAKHFAVEKVHNRGNSFNDCCHHGEVKIPSLTDLPVILRSLFEGTHPKSTNFFQCIRYLNNSFSFASFNANLINFNNQRSGPYCFKIQGQVYYQINTALYPCLNERPTFGQLFIYDGDQAVQFRSQNNRECDIEILNELDAFMREHNVFAQTYVMMKEVIEDKKNKNNNIEPELSLAFTLKPGVDKRRYNLQKENEVAAVFSTSANGEIPESYVSIVNKDTKTLQYISSMNPNVEPWIYPLFFPFGTPGWNPNIRCQIRMNRVTRNDYYKYQIAIRDKFNVILMGRRLFQQWIVDAYVKVEKDRMNYLRNNQGQIRAELYQGLIDYLNDRVEQNNGNIGRIVILPSTFEGSPRNMVQRYQDAMAIVRQFGKPDLFITMTCNPNWCEIKENLLPGQSPSDRPDIVTRVFDIKKDELINLIVKRQYFGEVSAYIYVIEFQKRGLPHVHMLVTLKNNYKITTPEVVDKYICAEIPNQTEDPILYDIVTINMLHGPCGNWCLVNQKCSKKFPKEYRDETIMDDDGYPYYKHRNTGMVFMRNGNTFNNQHVVPYNKVLLKTFNCHINVEIVSSIKSVKYLYKYVYKGHDRALMTISDNVDNNDTTVNHDEITNHIESLYVGPAEAAWRILSKSLHDKSHSITRLAVHLPNRQSIPFQNHFNHTQLMNALRKDSTLMAYFELNQRDPQARNFLYTEIPIHYVFKKTKNYHRWEQRKRQFNVIGRMYSISPTQIELFHLRLLLLTVKGATSFENLRTVNGTVYDTFVQTCLALGLIEDDEEWKRALHEAEGWMMPLQLRDLFIRIILHCSPLHPEDLWEEFKEALSEDYIHKFGEINGNRKAFVFINSELNKEGSQSLSIPNMLPITDAEIFDADNIDHTSQTLNDGIEMYNKLNEKQKEIVDFVLNIIDTHDAIDQNDNDNHCNCIYIDGPGGSGKTFTYITLYHLLRARQKKICTTAYTGIAATLLPNGKTSHKTFGLPVPLFSDSVSNFKPNSKQGKYLKNIDVVIWDEAPMAPKHALEVADRILRDIMNNDLQFGGKIMILGGDFRQLLPVMKNATRSESVSLSIKFSPLWQCFKIFSLTQNMRALPSEIEFAKFLLDVGEGVLNDPTDNICLPQECNISTSDNIVNDIYRPLISNKKFNELSKYAILSPRNIDVNRINQEVVQLLDSTGERLYTSIDSTENCDNDDINDAIIPEFLNTLNPPNFPPHELRLRLNTVVMLIRNLNINEGLCNGTRLLILELRNNLLKCKILNGDKTGDIVFINRITLYCENTYSFKFKRRQFPVTLAFAMTINKAQGQTFEKIGVELTKYVFTHGQLYVAFSRIRSWESLNIYIGNQRDNNVVKNDVYQELYQ